MVSEDLPVVEFAFPGALRDQLVAAIVAGSKTTTSGLVADYQHEGEALPRPGQREAVVDSAGRRVAVIKTTAVRVIRLGDVDLAHALGEGEGYTSVAQWRAGHERFWHSAQMREAMDDPEFTVDDDTLMVAQAFRLVETGSGEPTGVAKRDAAYFDQWYADMASSARDAIVTRALGLPPELKSASMLTWQGVAEVAQALRMPRDGLLVDLACGRGGYGIEVARRTGARLLGVDFSQVALEQARLSSARLWPAGQSEFLVGSLMATGLSTGVADGLMCVDGVQFADPPLAALREFRRLLAPGARLVLTCWEAADSADERVSARIRAVHLRRDLPAAGFADVQVHDKPEWREAERRMWQETLAAPAGDDAGLQSLQAEGRRSLDTFDSLRRVFATATAP
jgi:uncharacterized protein YhfF/ubiquinone/menaquinone biosynthesis C-methylase UbiE